MLSNLVDMFQSNDDELDILQIL